jgi:hypothetical protein
LPAAVRTALGAFRADDALAFLGQLISAKASSGFSSQYLKQIDAWKDELTLLEAVAKALRAGLPVSDGWTLLLEYPVPRRDKCPDAVLLAGELIFVIEFKIGASTFDSAARWQVQDYALDLRDFHAESRGRPIIPILVATGALTAEPPVVTPDQAPAVWPVVCAAPAELASIIGTVFRATHQADSLPIDPVAWDESRYRPSPSIIDAACRLFGGHGVREISHAYADNLSKTSDALIAAIGESQATQQRTICFVTGVPGAGKTLTGLNAIHNPEAQAHEKQPGVFLSGNGPLVKIVREALVRDAVRIRKRSRKHAHREVGTFIQNVHAFIAEYTTQKQTERPHEHVVVFDEAQRAWSAEQVKKKRQTDGSEPHTMLEIMERCPEWCVLVALVGGGQEIHDGEAGLEEWGRALAARTAPWRVLVSPEALRGGLSLAGHRLFAGLAPSNCCVVEEPALHLDVSVRSFRAQRIAQWVQLVLDGEPEAAGAALAEAPEFPLVLTRDVETARRWLRERSRLERRCGLVVSSGSLRHRAYGIEVSSAFRRGYAYEEWFLAEKLDVRSSWQLEVAATEFECQGLELDWVGVCWGDDLCIDPGKARWCYRTFRGSKWQALRSEWARRYLLNKYRVLLTRAREGMVIWVPSGDPADSTRDPGPLDATAAYLTAAGVPSLE